MPDQEPQQEDPGALNSRNAPFPGMGTPLPSAPEVKFPEVDTMHRNYDATGQAIPIIDKQPEQQQQPVQQPTQPQQPQTNPPDHKLWEYLSKNQLYSKSYPDFQKQFNNQQSIDKLHDYLTKSELYSKSNEDFKNQFFSNLPSKEVTDAHDFINNVLSSPLANKAIDKLTGDQYYKSLQQQQQTASQGKDATRIATPVPIRLTGDVEQARKDYSEMAAQNPNLLRPVLTEIKRQNVINKPFSKTPADPTLNQNINKAAYIADANARPHSEAVVKYYADQLANGTMDYDLENKKLIKPEGTIASVFRGFKNHSDALDKYDYLTSHNDQDVINYLENQNKDNDPDKPEYKAVGVLPSIGQMIGENASATAKLGAGFIAGKLAGSLATSASPLLPELSLPIAAISAFGMGTGLQDFHHVSYANTLQDIYTELRQKGADPQTALEEAKHQANVAGAIAMGQGLIMGEAGSKLAKDAEFIPVRYGKNLAKFTKPLADIVKNSGNLVKSIAPDVTTQSFIAGGAKGIENMFQGKPITQGVGDAMASTTMFMLGLSALHAPDVVLGKAARNNLVDGYAKAPPAVVDHSLATLVAMDKITPEVAAETKQEIESHRESTKGVPDFTTPITHEASQLLTHIEETGAEPSSMNKQMLEKIAKDNGIEPEKTAEGKDKEMTSDEIVEKLQNKLKSAKLPKTFSESDPAASLSDIYKGEYEKDPEAFLRMVADQAHGGVTHPVTGEFKSSRAEAEQTFGKAMVDEAIKKYPEHIISEPKIEESGEQEGQAADQEVSEKPHFTVSTPNIVNVKSKLNIPDEEMNVLTMLHESKILSPDEKKILYKQYKNGVMNENDISKYTNIDISKVSPSEVDKWGQVILNKLKGKKISAEDIDFEDIPSQAKNKENGTVQESGSGSMVQHPQKGTGSEGSGRGRMEQSQQGNEATAENQNQSEGQQPEQSAEPTEQQAPGIGNETKADIGNPPPKKEETDASGDEGIGISKKAIFEQYGKKFEKTPMGWDEASKNAVGQLADDAARKGTSVEKEAESQVAQMAEEIKQGKLAVSKKRVVAAALHLMNQDEIIDDLLGRTADNPNDKFALATELALQKQNRDATIKVIDEMGSHSGYNLGLFAGMFSKGGENDVNIARRRIEAFTGTLPETLKDLEASNMPESQKNKIRHYVEKLEKIKADYEKGIEEAKKLAPKEKKMSIAQTGKAIADKIRENAKLNRPGSFSAATPASVVWDGAVEVVAQAIEKGALLADAIKQGIVHIKNTDWYKGLSEDKKETAEKEFSNWHNEQAQDALTPEGKTKRVEDAMKATQRSLDEYQKHLDNKTTKLKKPTVEETEQLKSLREKRDKAKADYNEMIKTGVKPKEGKIGYNVKEDARDAAIMFQKRKTEGQLRALTNMAEDANRGWWNKALDWRRGFLIGGFKTLARVGEAGAAKLTIDPIANITTGNIVGLLPGLEARRVTPKTVQSGLESLIKFPNDKAAMDFVKQKQSAFEKATDEINKNPDDKNVQKKYMQAEMENAQAQIYQMIHGNVAIDMKELAKFGSTDFDQTMGGYTKINPSDLHGSDKLLYYLNTLARMHGIEKAPSARRALVEGYNSKLLEYQKQGLPLTAGTRMRALDMAYLDFLQGKYQESTQLGDYVNERKYEGKQPNASLVKKTISGFLRIAMPVAKIAINLTKQGVDMSTIGMEGVLRYMHETFKGMKLNEAEGKEYDNIFKEMAEGARRMPEEDARYIHNVLKQGLFGAALYLTAASMIKNGSIQYGGEYDDKHIGSARRKYKGEDGKWYNDLDYGQWVINGHKFGKFGSSVLNHLPQFLPVAMAVNSHNVYQYEHEYHGAEGKRSDADIQAHRFTSDPNGKRKLKSGEDAAWEAAKSDVNEISQRLPFGNILEPVRLAKNLLSIPATKDIGEYFDKDENGNLIERHPTSLLQQGAYNVGLRNLVDKKVDKEKQTKTTTPKLTLPTTYK